MAAVRILAGAVAVVAAACRFDPSGIPGDGGDTPSDASDIRDAARLMHERKLGALPVVEGERLVGILTETDVLDAFQRLLGAATSA